ncbi:MAG TPA: serine/threonine protein kinase [Cyanobacteria bacterium UBA11372]|nr:serine/threonine protein kinase [Cyanobacteria bacterium UBA11372]
MSINFPGYQISEQIYNGSRTLVYRGLRESDQQPAIVKILKNPYPSFAELLQFRNQYTIAKNLDLPGVVRPYSLETYCNGYALVMEDFGGISLKEYAVLLAAIEQTKSKALPITSFPGICQGTPLPIAEFLPIALQIVSTLDGLYRYRVIHKDIKPANILINPHTKQVKLIDFSISSLLPRETQTITSPNVLEGTLAYLSPEQTGRMNRGIDYRSDFYYLGVTFFEILTGKLPFSSDEPMELVHCHIAKEPPCVSSLKSDIPPILSQIVRKLMAKNAEERYQSALGLKSDIETCIARWKKTGYIDDFELGKRDISEVFIIPEKLYGRDQEIKTLLAAFERVVGEEDAKTRGWGDAEIEAPKAKSKTELMLVTGFSGIGKTAVVNEVHKPIVKQRGYFIKGKFDQFNRNIPFSAFVQAFRDLMWQLLTETDIKVQQWKSKMLAALGDQAKVIIEVIPELERIIGKQPPVQELSGSAAKNRFNLLFHKFISVFTTKEHPFVIFLDDLQWADSASLKLMQLLMSETDSGYLLLIGAYRDNEVSPVHPLILTLSEIKKAKATVNTIELDNLKSTDLNNLIADTLNCAAELALPLTELVYQKTKGNPFFATQFLKSLYEDKLITFIPPQSPLGKGGSQGGWQCDIAQVKALSLNDDVVEFMALQLQKLPEKTQDLLKLAACIGNSFDLATLAIVYQKSQAETAADLWKALQEGLLIPTSEVYKFFQDSEVSHSLSFIERESANYSGLQPVMVHLSLYSGSINAAAAQTQPEGLTSLACNPLYRFLHDRVQQAAYSLIPEETKQETHLKIGYLLLQNTTETERELNIFNIVNQLNLGRDAVTKCGVSRIAQSLQKDELAELNLIAGRKAKASAAYEAALRYSNIGLTLLTENSWQERYELILALHLEAIELEYLNSNFVRSAELADLTLRRTKTVLDNVAVYQLEIQFYIAQNQMLKAIETGLKALELLGFSLSPSSDADLANIEIPSLESVDSLKAMIDAFELAKVEILARLISPTYFAQPDLFPQVTLAVIKASFEHGYSALSAVGYGFGALLFLHPGYIDRGYHSGLLSLQLLERFHAKQIECKLQLIFNVFIRPHKEHGRASLIPFLNGLQVGLDTGDFEYASYCAMNYCNHLFFAGEHLKEVKELQEPYLALLLKLKLDFSINFLGIWRQTVLNLLGESVDATRLMGESFDETLTIPQLQASNSLTLLFSAYVAKSILLYLLGDYPACLEHSILAAECINSEFSPMMVSLHKFYYSLAILANYPVGDLGIVESNQEILQKWAQYAPMNFKHKYDLVAAEKHRVLGRKTEALELYDCAISVAKQNGYIQDEALANELAAKFYLEWGKEKIAQSYLIEAYYCYARWEAKAKVEDLEQRYPQLLYPILQQPKMPTNSGKTLSLEATKTVHSTNTNTSYALDLAAVIKASQALSSEIELDKLLVKLMQLALENAGADKGVLILNDRENWQVAFECVAGVECSVDSTPLEAAQNLPLTIINTVKRTHNLLLTQDVISHPAFISDRYLLETKPKSLLCTPILKQGELVAILYLENRLTIEAFTSDRITVLNLLCSQAAISLENARLYQQAQQALKDLQQTQLQLVQSEKMSALGNIVAGVAHEINNPVGFISGNINEAIASVQDITEFLQLYQEKFPHPGDEIEEKAAELDIEYLLEDLPKMLASMQAGCDRIKNISTSLRIFSRADTAEKVEANIHEGLDSTLMILRHRLKANEKRPEIQIVKEYGNIPQVKCYLGQLNQVFMNILANAIDSLDESNQNRTFAEIQNCPNTITIKTEVSPDRQNVLIKIKDNGKGMTEEVKAQIFDRLFTTKAVGKGTGLGLSISRQIVTETHRGSLTCESVLGEGTEFAIMLRIADAIALPVE